MKAEIWAKRRGMPLLLVLFIVIGIVRAHSAVVLLDAETEADVAAWKGLKRCSGSRQPFLPILGNASAWVQVSPPKAPATSPRQTATRLELPVTDWRPYDCLVLDAFNDGVLPTLMRIEVGTAWR